MDNSLLHREIHFNLIFKLFINSLFFNITIFRYGLVRMPNSGFHNSILLHIKSMIIYLPYYFPWEIKLSSINNQVYLLKIDLFKIIVEKS